MAHNKHLDSTQIQDLQNFVLDALEVVEFKLIRYKEDVDDDSLKFSPLMAHQIFGESESIFGYENLKVRILYTAGPLQTYIGIKYDKKVDEITNDNIKADDVAGTIASKLPEGCYFVNLDEFLKTLDKADKFQPFGEKLTEHKCVDNEGNERYFEIYHCDYKTPSFVKFFVRLETFVLWFVDAASYIDVDDPQWSYFVCYEKYKNRDGVYQYAAAGYTTVYEYYAYPQNIRPRISQMLVLPPFQKLRIGTNFIETIYKYYQVQKSVVDITVEDPSEDFQRLRNFVDSRLCLHLDCFKKDLVKKGFSKDMIKEAREKLKINPKQCRKVYEIIRLYYTNIYDVEEYKVYRLDVKKRLNSVYHKQLSDIKKMESVKIDTQWMRATLPTMEERLVQLHQEYTIVENGYKHVVEKLKA